MAEDDSANNLPFLDDDVGSPSSDSAGNVLSESFVESVVMPDKTIVVQGVAGLDSPALPSPISSSQETDFAKKLVESALSDPCTVDHIDNESGIATDIPTTTADQVILDDMISSSETVSALLAASEEAAAAAEAKLSAEEAKMVPPLIPTSQNGTFGDATISVQEIPDILPASQVVGEPITAVPTEIETPNVKKILKFAIPAIGVWLCGPLLSLIDTSAVGLFSGTYQQAALNPAVAVTDYAALLIAFMYTATTNLVASAQETDRGVEGKPRTTKKLVSAMKISGFVGAALGTTLFVFARTLLRTIIGNDAINPEVFAAAMKYVRIRAIGMPAAVVIGSTQSACLGMQDIKTPLYVLAAAAIVNFFGDLLFVPSAHPLLGGAAGAAWATVFSQYAAAAFFTKWLCDRPKKKTSKVVNVSKAIMELTGNAESEGEPRRKKFSADLRRMAKNVAGNNGVARKLSSMKKRFSTTDKPKADSPKSESFSTRGFLAGKFHASDYLSLPSKEDISDFVPYVVPVTTTQVGRVSSYVAMSHVVASSLGTVCMAAQQVIVSLFYCLCPVTDSLSLTAQSFVPSISEKKISGERSKALRKTGLSFLKAGTVFGALLVAAVGTIPLISRFFTSDPAVVAMVNSVAPWLAGIFAVNGIMCASEGMLLGQKDLSFLGKSYAGFFVAVPYLMLRQKKAALAGIGNVQLTSLWKIFFAYNVFRSGLWVARCAQLQLRTQRQAAAAVDEASTI
jgi:Na+-driven multidrug efflux pump